MNKAFARKLIEKPTQETTAELYRGVAGVFWVDWREADVEIIRLASNTIPHVELTPKWIEKKLYINFQEQLTEIPLKFEPGEQDITIRTLNKALSPEFEIRFVKASDGGDTIAFLTLDKNSWLELEAAFGERVSDAFEKIDENSTFFS